MDPENAEAMGIYAHTCSWKKDFATALHYLRSGAAAQSEPARRLGAERGRALLHRRLRRRAQAHGSLPRAGAVRSVFRLLREHRRDRAPDRRRLCDRRHHRPPRRQGKSAVHQRLKAADRGARPPWPRDEAKPYIKKLLDIEPNFTVQAAMARCIRSPMTTIAPITWKGCGSPACPRASRAPSLAYRLRPIFFLSPGGVL